MNSNTHRIANITICFEQVSLFVLWCNVLFYCYFVVDKKILSMRIEPRVVAPINSVLDKSAIEQKRYLLCQSLFSHSICLCEQNFPVSSFLINLFTFLMGTLEWVSIICRKERKKGSFHGKPFSGENSIKESRTKLLFRMSSLSQISLKCDRMIYVKFCPNLIKSHQKFHQPKFF